MIIKTAIGQIDWIDTQKPWAANWYASTTAAVAVANLESSHFVLQIKIEKKNHNFTQ